MVTPLPEWSLILKDMLKTTAERQRLSTALGVTTMTLNRWANGESRPQRSHLIHLLQVVQNKYRESLIEALKPHYPDIQSWLTEDNNDHIPASFFAHILHLRTTTTESLLFWHISEAILKQALAQLDPNNLGMAIKLIQCMPPSSDGKVRSLRERAGKGTLPWAADLEYDVLFLGLESMSGYAAEVRHIVSDGDLRKSKTIPAYKAEYELSAAAHPIRFEGLIAGCLLASSTQVEYFTPQRQGLLTAFSDLIALAFNKEDFYPPQMIELRVMPGPHIQRPLLATFRQRVTAKFQQAMIAGEPMSSPDIELQVWQELEQELLAIRDDSFETHHLTTYSPSQNDIQPPA